MNIRYGSILERSSEHYPHKTAAAVYLAGCPLKCGWCNTPFLLTNENADTKTVEWFHTHFAKHRPELEAVCFLGGEPLMQGNALVNLSKLLKNEGFLVRVETSGYYAENLRDLLPYVDWLSFDVKTKLDAAAYAEITGFQSNPELLLSNIFRSLAYAERSKAHREFRTTIIPGKNDDVQTISEICDVIKKFCDAYVLQEFNPLPPLAGPGYEQAKSPSKDKLVELAMAARNVIHNVAIRTTEGTEWLR